MRIAISALAATLLLAAPLHAQRAASSPPSGCVPGGARCITVSFREADIRDVAAAFAEVSGFSIVLGSGVSGAVTAEIRNQPWDVALETILRAHELAARETHPGILRIDAWERLREGEIVEPLVTRIFQINYMPAQELVASLDALKSERGSIVASPSTNTLLVTDTEASVARIAEVLGKPPR